MENLSNETAPPRIDRTSFALDRDLLLLLRTVAYLEREPMRAVWSAPCAGKSAISNGVVGRRSRSARFKKADPAGIW